MIVRTGCIVLLGVSFAVTSAEALAQESAPPPPLLRAARATLVSFERLRLAQLEGLLIHLYRERAAMDQQMSSWTIKSEADMPQSQEGEGVSPEVIHRYAENSVAAWKKSAEIDRNIDRTQREIQDIENELKREVIELHLGDSPQAKQ